MAEPEYEDYWRKAVQLFTGFAAPERATLFAGGKEKSGIVGNDDIKQMKVEITKQDSVDTVDVDDWQWKVDNAGYDINNTDFVIPFYTDNGSVSMYKARITLLGVKTMSDDEFVGSDDSVGSEGESKYAKDLKDGAFQKASGGNNLTWDTFDLTKYSYGTGKALQALLDNENGTLGFSWGGESALPLDKAVRLGSFDMAAEAFDRVAKFFYDSNATMTEWQKRLGLEESEAWQGMAAGVFWDLIHEVGGRYENYAEDMGYIGGSSKQGRELRAAGEALRTQTQNLVNAWDEWTREKGNPLRWLVDLLTEISDNSWDNNITKIDSEYQYSSSAYSSGYFTYSTTGGFTQQAVDANRKVYGDMKELTTWKAVGDEAVKRWEEGVKDGLIDPAEYALDALSKAWGSRVFDLGSISTRGDKGLSGEWAEDKAAKDKKA
ncbi:AAWKG family protein, partial [Streptomyces sp. NPDC005962]|uniref:AAWKG family protein n=1 Tax=Streptomyces sp. NPDC005962 TaxID=3154466 RepID=UPI0033FFE73C